MNIARALINGSPQRGEVKGDWFYPLAEDPADSQIYLGPRIEIGSLTILSPVSPSKILTIINGFLKGREHVEARADPIQLTAKLTSSLNASESQIVIPLLPEDLNFPVVAEGELAVVIGRSCRRVSPEEAEAVILGYTCLNDVSIKGLAKADGDFMRSKSADTFCPIGPWITTDIGASTIDRGLEISTRINGVLRQFGSTRDYVHQVREVVSEASQLYTLMPGDVISLGTPPPPAEIKVGDFVEVEVESIGVLRNQVVGEESDFILNPMPAA